jgi:hypothetical protein
VPHGVFVRTSNLAFVLLFLAACGDSSPKPKTDKDPVTTGDDAGSSDAATPAEDAEVAEPEPEADAGLDAEVKDPAQEDAALGSDASAAEDAGAATPDAATPDAAAEDAAVVEQDAGTDAEVPDPGPDPKDVKLAADVEAKLRSCDVVGSGTFNAGKVEDAFDRCIGNCIVSASCAVLSNAFCPPPVFGTSADNAFVACQNNCYGQPIPEDGFVCNDGSVIYHLMVCDDGLFSLDCPGGEDEMNCGAPFVCANGDQISSKYRCDGVKIDPLSVNSIGGCKDGSDEVGCAPLCAN